MRSPPTDWSLNVGYVRSCDFKVWQTQHLLGWIIIPDTQVILSVGWRYQNHIMIKPVNFYTVLVLLPLHFNQVSKIK